MNVLAPLITLLLSYSEQKLVDFSIQNQPLKFLEKSKLDHMLQNWLKSQFSRKFKHWLWIVQSTNFGFEGAKRSVMNGAMTFFCSFDKNDLFRVMADHWKSGYFKVMKYFGFIILTRSVALRYFERLWLPTFTIL